VKHHSDPLIDELIRQKGAKAIPGMETMDEGLRDRTAAKRKAIAEALLKRRRELETGLVHIPGELRTFGRTREA
jgi:hypothetical protein